MDQRVLGHIAYQICNAVVQHWPFPHIYVEDVFPDDFYQQLLANLPPVEAYSASTSRYHGRQFADPQSLRIPSMLDMLRTPDFTQIASFPFLHYIKKRFGSINFPAYTDLRLVRDRQNYSIGPHTDAVWKVLSFLFYLPPSYDLEPYGTSIYLPHDPSFTCPGGPHYPHANFTLIHTAPFRPNSLFAFFKTPYSFHGVDPITIPCQRDVLLWNLYDREARNASVQAT